MAFNNHRNSTRRHDRREINIKQVCDHLSWLFANATKGQGRAIRGNKLHEYQVDFCYYLDDIQRGPTYIVPKVIAECNEFLDRMTQELAVAAAATK